jgi:hypothetical protein
VIWLSGPVFLKSFEPNRDREMVAPLAHCSPLRNSAASSHKCATTAQAVHGIAAKGVPQFRAERFLRHQKRAQNYKETQCQNIQPIQNR